MLECAWYNADEVREMAGDWDFSDDGRKRQSQRMNTFAEFEKSHGRYVICDFVCPTEKTRETTGQRKNNEPRKQHNRNKTSKSEKKHKTQRTTTASSETVKNKKRKRKKKRKELDR